MQPAIPLLFLLLSLSVQVIEGRKDGSLYDVLGVSRDANQKEIRSAYKRLARQWHPDKNKSPEAQEKILEINKAYEVLSGEQSRRHYDMTGETDPAPSGSQSHAHNSHGFTFFHAGNGFFHFGGFGHSQPREDTITTHYFQNTVLPESNSRLWLLYFFGDFCMQCGEVSRIWDELKMEMKSSGVAMASVHSSRQYSIPSHCDVDRIPSVVAVMNRRVFHYSGHWQARNIRNFVKNTLPSWTISELTAESLEAFISDSIARNRPRIILFSPHPQPSLLYKSVAFSNQPVADFGFLTTDKLPHKSLGVLQQYGVSWRSKKLLVFKEYPHNPSTVLEGSEVTGDALRSVVEKVKLYLPRLTSQQILDNTCGNNGRLCLILVVGGPETYNDTITTTFRQQMSTVEVALHIPVAYIDKNTQSQFISSFPGSSESKMKCADGQESRNVLLLWRKTGFHSSYDWFSGYCGNSDDFDSLMVFTRETSLKTTTNPAPNLLDEFAPGILSRIWNGVIERFYQVYDYAKANSNVLSLLTMTGVMASTLCCASIVGASNMPEEPKKRHGGRRKQSHQKRTNEDSRSPLIPALTTQLYQQLIEDGDRGSVVILILINSGARENTLFISEILKRHKRQRVFFFCGALESHCYWLSELLEGSSMDPVEVERRKRWYFGESAHSRLCALVILPAKKKFAIFPESLAEAMSSSRGDDVMSENFSSRVSGESLANGLGVRGSDRNKQLMDTIMGSFGFEDDAVAGLEEEEEEEEEEGEMERGLKVWMERLEDGSLKRYSTDSWPLWQ